MANWKQQQAEIEECLRKVTKEELKAFRTVTHLLAVWQECEGEIKHTQYAACAPSWFYPYVNSL